MKSRFATRSTMLGLTTALSLFIFLIARPVNAQWQFGGAYTESPYGTSYGAYALGYGDNWASDSTAGLRDGVGGASAADQGTGTWAECGAGYSYYPMFVWSGDPYGNPDHPLTAAYVSMSVAATTNVPSYEAPGTYGFVDTYAGLSIGIYNVYNYYFTGDPTSSDWFSLSIVAVDNSNISFSSTQVSWGLETDAVASGSPSGIYSAAIGIVLNYDLEW